mgnify:CR=1 FL=1
MLSLIMFGVGLISGMYIVTQFEKGIDKNIKNNESKRQGRNNS